MRSCAVVLPCQDRRPMPYLEKNGSILSLLHSYMAKTITMHKRLTADIPSYSWLKMGKGPVILIVLSLIVCCKTVPLKSSISVNPFEQGNEFSLKFYIFSKNNCVCRKPYLIFKNRIHISYIEDFAITKPLDFQNLSDQICLLSWVI